MTTIYIWVFLFIFLQYISKVMNNTFKKTYISLFSS